MEAMKMGWPDVAARYPERLDSEVSRDRLELGSGSPPGEVTGHQRCLPVTVKKANWAPWCGFPWASAWGDPPHSLALQVFTSTCPVSSTCSLTDRAVSWALSLGRCVGAGGECPRAHGEGRVDAQRRMRVKGRGNLFYLRCITHVIFCRLAQPGHPAMGETSTSVPGGSRPCIPHAHPGWWKCSRWSHEEAETQGGMFLEVQ